MMVLVSGPKDLNLIALNGDISTVDLLHLRGHFGIPRFSGDRFVSGPSGPAPRGRQPYVSPGPATSMPEQAPEPGPEQYPGSVGIGSPTVEAAPPPPTPPGF